MKDKKQNTIIHIGMPKAASTSLQQNFFSRLPLINYVGLGSDNTALKKALKRIIFEKDLYYRESEIKNVFETSFKKNLPIVLSHENVCMPILKQFTKIPQERETIANRFKAIYPDAKILIIIRNQFNIHQSMYVQKLKGERNNIPIKKISFNKWINWNINLHENGQDNIFRFAEYDSIISLYKSLFREVKVVIFEEMIKDMQSFVSDELCTFIQVDSEKAMKHYFDTKKNSRRSKASIMTEEGIRITLNFFRDKLGNPQKNISIEKRKTIMKRIHRITHLIPFGKIDTTYSENEKKFLETYYKAGNRKVSEQIGIDLGKYGYPI